MKTRRVRSRYLLVVAGVLALATSCAPFIVELEPIPGTQTVTAYCAGWNTREFFRWATPARVRRCLEFGAGVNARDGLSLTPLHNAAWYTDDPAIIRVLVGSGAWVNARTGDGWTPLHFAAAFNPNPAIIWTLVAADSWVNARTGDGWTPLHLAAWNTGTAAVIEALLDAGANAAARDSDGLTPWDHAQHNEALRGIDVYWRLHDGRFE